MSNHTIAVTITDEEYGTVQALLDERIHQLETTNPAPHEAEVLEELRRQLTDTWQHAETFHALHPAGSIPRCPPAGDEQPRARRSAG